MKQVPIVFWLAVGIAGLFAYSYAHRRAQLRGQLAQQRQENEIPLQPFTQPQPAASGWPSYGPVPLGQDATTSTHPARQYAYTSSIGALA